MTCICCGGTDFEVAMPTYDIDLVITNIAEVARVAYFHPLTFTVAPPDYAPVLDKALVGRTQEEQSASMPFHVKNSGNYEYVRVHYKLEDANVRPHVYKRVTPVDANMFCVRCYVACLQKVMDKKLEVLKKHREAVKKQQDAEHEAKLLAVVANPLFTHVTLPDTRKCSFCSNPFANSEMIVWSFSQPETFICMRGFEELHRKLMTK